MKLTGSGCTALFSMGLSERDVKELERYRTSVKTADESRTKESPSLRRTDRAVRAANIGREYPSSAAL
jgi:hypothetical protein